MVTGVNKQKPTRLDSPCNRPNNRSKTLTFHPRQMITGSIQQSIFLLSSLVAYTMGVGKPWYDFGTTESSSSYCGSNSNASTYNSSSYGKASCDTATCSEIERFYSCASAEEGSEQAAMNRTGHSAHIYSDQEDRHKEPEVQEYQQPDDESIFEMMQMTMELSVMSEEEPVEDGGEDDDREVWRGDADSEAVDEVKTRNNIESDQEKENCEYEEGIIESVHAEVKTEKVDLPQSDDKLEFEFEDESVVDFESKTISYDDDDEEEEEFQPDPTFKHDSSDDDGVNDLFIRFVNRNRQNIARSDDDKDEPDRNDYKLPTIPDHFFLDHNDYNSSE